MRVVRLRVTRPNSRPGHWAFTEKTPPDSTVAVKWCLLEPAERNDQACQLIVGIRDRSIEGPEVVELLDSGEIDDDRRLILLPISKARSTETATFFDAFVTVARDILGRSRNQGLLPIRPWRCPPARGRIVNLAGIGKESRRHDREHGPVFEPLRPNFRADEILTPKLFLQCNMATPHRIGLWGSKTASQKGPIFL